MNRGVAYLSPIVAVVAAMGVVEACSQAATPASSGGTCQLTSDCQEGYVCITQADGTRQCSSDLSSIALTEEAGGEAAAMPMEAAAPGDSGAPPQEGGMPPQDTGAAPQDTGSPPQEAGD